MEEMDRKSREELLRIEDNIAGAERYGFPRRHMSMLKRRYNGSADWPKLMWPDHEKVEKAHARIAEAGSCVILIGPRGTGKTQLAAELAVNLQGVYGRYSTLAGLLQQEKDSWSGAPIGDDGRKVSPLREARKSGLLVLDEIQEVAGTDWELSQFVRIFDERYQDMSRTILISNLMPEAMQKFVGPSVWSRISETGLVILCGGEDWGSYR